MLRLVTMLLLILGLGACGATASPTATFAHFTSADITKALTPLGITNVKAAVRDPQSVAPNTARDNQEFTIPSIAPKGGQVMTFATPSDLAAMQAWFARFPDLAPYVYVNGNALVQLNSTLPQAEAEKYRVAVAALR